MSEVVARSTVSGTVVPYFESLPNSGQQLVRHVPFAAGPQRDRSNTEVVTFGCGDEGQLLRHPGLTPAPVPLAADVLHFALSPSHAVLVVGDGHVMAGGSNEEGQCSPGRPAEQELADPERPHVVQELETQHILTASAGAGHTAVVNHSHAVLTYGLNEHGQLGHSGPAGDEPEQAYRVAPRLVRGLAGHRVIDVACGGNHTLFLTSQGRVFSAGLGAQGQLGLGQPASSWEAQPVQALRGVPVRWIAAGEAHSLAISTTGALFTWGRNKRGQCGLPVAQHPHSVRQPTRVVNLPELAQVARCGAEFTIAVSHSGRVWAFGRGDSGQLGVGLPADPSAWASPPAPTQQAAGHATPAAAKRLLCVDTPRLMVDLPEQGAAREVACGERHTLVLMRDGSVYATGDNRRGQLGIEGEGEGRLWAPRVVPSLSHRGIFSLCAGGETSAAIRVVCGSVLSIPAGASPSGATPFVSAHAFEEVASAARASGDVALLRKLVREVLGNLETLNASFLQATPEQGTLLEVRAPGSPSIGSLLAMMSPRARQSIGRGQFALDAIADSARRAGLRLDHAVPLADGEAGVGAHAQASVGGSLSPEQEEEQKEGKEAVGQRRPRHAAAVGPPGGGDDQEFTLIMHGHRELVPVATFAGPASAEGAPAVGQDADGAAAEPASRAPSGSHGRMRRAQTTGTALPALIGTQQPGFTVVEFRQQRPDWERRAAPERATRDRLLPLDPHVPTSPPAKRQALSLGEGPAAAAGGCAPGGDATRLGRHASLPMPRRTCLGALRDLFTGHHRTRNRVSDNRLPRLDGSRGRMGRRNLSTATHASQVVRDLTGADDEDLRQEAEQAAANRLQSTASHSGSAAASPTGGGSYLQPSPATGDASSMAAAGGRRGGLRRTGTSEPLLPAEHDAAALGDLDNDSAFPEPMTIDIFGPMDAVVSDEDVEAAEAEHTQSVRVPGATTPSRLRVHAAAHHVLPAAAHAGERVRSSTIQVRSLARAFRSVLATGDDGVVRAALEGISASLHTAQALAPLLQDPDQLRGLLSLSLCPLLGSARAPGPGLLARYCAVILSLPRQSRSLLFDWVARDIPASFWRDRLVAPLQQGLSASLQSCLQGEHATILLGSRPLGSAATAVAATAATAAASLPVTPGGGGSTQPAGSGVQADASQQPAATAAAPARDSFPEGISNLQAMALFARLLRLHYLANERVAEARRRAAGLAVVAAPSRRERRLGDASAAILGHPRPWGAAAPAPAASAAGGDDADDNDAPDRAGQASAPAPADVSEDTMWEGIGVSWQREREYADVDLLPADGEGAPVATDAVTISEQDIVWGAMSYEDFYNPTVSNLPDAILQLDYQRWNRDGLRRTLSDISFCGYPFLLSTAAKRRVLRYEALLQQSTQMRNALVRSLFQRESPYFVLRVRRDHIVQDALQGILSVPTRDLKKQLKVVFLGEEGIDAGGVAKDFFVQVTERLFTPDTGMFLFNEDTRQYWFNPAVQDDQQTRADFMLVGVVVGLAIFNGVLLDVQMPAALYRKLLGYPVGMLELMEVQEATARGLQHLLKYEGDDVEDVFCLSYEASYQGLFGEEQTAELIPDGGKVPVTATNRRDYVTKLVDWQLNKSIEWQFRQFARGFSMIADGPALHLFRSEELELLVCGTAVLDIDALQRTTTYDGGFTEASPAVQAFWTVLRSFSVEDQRRLLQFATGSAKAPIGGLGNLTFKIQRNGPDSDRLPTASTCFNTLLLPDYATEEKLRHQLLLAIRETAGFGLQ